MLTSLIITYMEIKSVQQVDLRIKNNNKNSLKISFDLLFECVDKISIYNLNGSCERRFIE